MNIDNPIQPVLAAPFGIDVNIENLRPRLADLPWMERCFGRAVALYEEDGAVRIPKVPIGTEILNGQREYFSCLPNDTQTAFGWFKPINPMEPVEQGGAYQQSRIYKQRCDFYLWASLDRIDKTNLGLGEKLKSEIINIFETSPSVYVQGVISDDIKEVYSGWTLHQVDQHLLYYPYYAARFELMMDVTENKC